MGKLLHLTRLCLLLTAFAGLTSYAQSPTPPPTFPLCATPDLPRDQALDLIRRANQVYQQKKNSGATFQTITYGGGDQHHIVLTHGLNYSNNLRVARKNQLPRRGTVGLHRRLDFHHGLFPACLPERAWRIYYVGQRRLDYKRRGWYAVRYSVPRGRYRQPDNVQ